MKHVCLAIVTLAGLAGLAGCDQLFSPQGRYEPVAPSYEIRGGDVTWQLVESDCPEAVQELWREDGRAYVFIEGDAIEMHFDTTAPVSGVLRNGLASVQGEQVFMGDDGEDVSCVVDGHAAIDGAADRVDGALTETLSSLGGMNCRSRALYRLTLD